MLLWCFVLYSQYPEPQSFLGSHLDKSAPSSHCEDSGKEGSSVLVSTNKWRKMRTAQYVFQPQQPQLLVSHRVSCYTAEVWATKLECMTDMHSVQKNPKPPQAEAVSVREPVTLSNSRAVHRSPHTSGSFWSTHAGAALTSPFLNIHCEESATTTGFQAVSMREVISPQL